MNDDDYVKQNIKDLFENVIKIEKKSLEVADINLIYKESNKEFSGRAFVSFQYKEDVENLLNSISKNICCSFCCKNGYVKLNGKQIKVTPAANPTDYNF